MVIWTLVMPITHVMFTVIKILAMKIKLSHLLVFKKVHNFESICNKVTYVKIIYSEN